MTKDNSRAICTVVDCDKPIQCSGLCSMHRARLRRQRLAESGVICRIAGCDKPIDSLKHHLCQRHLVIQSRYGSPEAQVGVPTGEPLQCAIIIATQMPLPNTCINWPRNMDVHGYGVLSHGRGPAYKAHRVVLAYYQGLDIDTLPDPKIETRHLCPGKHNRACVNPLHLEFGTHRENMEDVIEQGSQKGSNNPMARLNEDKVRSILVDPRPNFEIAVEYGTTSHNISRIKNRQRWKHVTIETDAA